MTNLRANPSPYSRITPSVLEGFMAELTALTQKYGVRVNLASVRIEESIVLICSDDSPLLPATKP